MIGTPALERIWIASRAPYRPGSKIKLTPALKARIASVARDTKDFCDVAFATGVSPELLELWIERGWREETGIYRDLVVDLAGVLVEMCARKADVLEKSLVALLNEMPERHALILLAKVLCPFVNDRFLSQEQRLAILTLVGKAIGRPIHPGRWWIVKEAAGGHIPKVDLENFKLSAIIEAADTLIQEDPDKRSRPIEFFDAVKQLINNLVSQDVVPNWWRKTKEDDWDEAGARESDDARTRHEEMERWDRRHKFMLGQVSKLAKMTPARLEEIIRKRRIETVKDLSEFLGLERTKVYRKIVNPARKL